MTQQNFEKYKILAERYTKALLNIARENDIVEKIGNELKEVRDIFVQNSDIENFF